MQRINEANIQLSWLSRFGQYKIYKLWKKSSISFRNKTGNPIARVANCSPGFGNLSCLLMELHLAIIYYNNDIMDQRIIGCFEWECCTTWVEFIDGYNNKFLVLVLKF